MFFSACPTITGVSNCATCTGERCDTCNEDYYLSPTATADDHMCRRK